VPSAAREVGDARLRAIIGRIAIFEMECAAPRNAAIGGGGWGDNKRCRADYNSPCGPGICTRERDVAITSLDLPPNRPLCERYDEERLHAGLAYSQPAEHY